MRTSYLNIQTRDVIFYALKKKKKKKENIVRVRAKKFHQIRSKVWLVSSTIRITPVQTIPCPISAFFFPKKEGEKKKNNFQFSWSLARY